jgi:hypothetical protein
LQTISRAAITHQNKVANSSEPYPINLLERYGSHLSELVTMSVLQILSRDPPGPEGSSDKRVREHVRAMLARLKSYIIKRPGDDQSRAA